MPWNIQDQEESIGKMKFPTKCKRIKYFPIEGQNGEVSFGKLGFLMLQVVVKHDKGDELKLKLNASNGVANPRFTIAHPDKEEYPWLKLGRGARVSKVRDVLAPKVKVKGEQERYDDAEGFRKRLASFAGENVANEVLGLFAGRLASIETSDTNKRVYANVA